MQIYVVGAHGVGKTTLVHRLQHELGLPVYPEYARDIFHDLNKDRSTMTPLEYLQFQSTLTCWFASLRNKTNFISDRSLIDVGAYTTWYYHKHESEIDNFYKPLWHNLMHMTYEFVDLRSDSVYIYMTDDQLDADQQFIDQYISNRLHLHFGCFHDTNNVVSYTKYTPIYVIIEHCHKLLGGW